MVTRLYTVPDMSCEHCVRTITAAVQRVPGVRKVQVDLAAKRVTVQMDEEVRDQDVRDAIIDAGYTVAS